MELNVEIERHEPISEEEIELREQCKECFQDKGSHRAKDLACPMRVGGYYDGTMFRSARPS